MITKACGICGEPAVLHRKDGQPHERHVKGDRHRAALRAISAMESLLDDERMRSAEEVRRDAIDGLRSMLPRQRAALVELVRRQLPPGMGWLYKLIRDAVMDSCTRGT